MLSHAQDTSILSDAEINDKFPRVAALLSTELPHGSQVSDEKLWNKIAEAATGVVPEDYTINEEDQLGTVSLAVEVVLPANQVPGKKPIFAPVHVDDNYRGCELSSVLILNSTDAPISDDLRHKLHEATGEQINELLKSGEASPEQVLSAVVPLVKANWPRNGSDPQSSSANTATYYTESDSTSSCLN